MDGPDETIRVVRGGNGPLPLKSRDRLPTGRREQGLRNEPRREIKECLLKGVLLQGIEEEVKTVLAVECQNKEGGKGGGARESSCPRGNPAGLVKKSGGLKKEMPCPIHNQPDRTKTRVWGVKEKGGSCTGLKTRKIRYGDLNIPCCPEE